ncbi:right-handed parallel beta-helix repeat-containing protein [Salinispora sp. H7-4]|uniref:right-handed parallel beta-helix repeat-containing protein n=1 Tax=Salinispora sp. H7-4 TaxID=2748321 RepID=UPI0035C9DA10
MTGVALATVGVVTPVGETVRRALPAVGASGTPVIGPSVGDGRDEGSGTADRSDAGRGDAGRGDGKQGERRAGKPVPCDPDRLIAEIALANAGGGAVLDLAEGCTYLLTADLGGAGLPAITTPIILTGGRNTTIERAAAVDQFRILAVTTGGELTLNQLTITGGHAAEGGGGIFVNTGGVLTVNHSVVHRNIADILGGGIANNGTARVSHSSVERNIGNQRGGGIFSAGPLELVQSHVRGNIADLGGGVFASDSGVTVQGGSIADNWAQSVGGLFVSGGIGTVTGTRIIRNTSHSDGGGVRVGLGGQLTLRWVRLTGNTALSGLAGGLFVEGDIGGGSYVVIEDSIIKDNTAMAAAGGGIFNAGQTVVRRTRILGNRADRGGGIHNSGTVSLAATKVVDNLAVTDGGGVVNDGGTVDLNTATGTIVIKNRPNNCVDVAGCAG